MTFSGGGAAVVVDASAAIEVLQGSGELLGLWANWIETDTLILAPAHFPVEVANALSRGLRMPPEVVSRRLELLYRAGFETVDRGLDGLLSSVGLASRHGLTVYDAAYLDLAIDTDAELATLDVALSRAATAEGVPASIGHT
jgi:predicted nucleic acid-binding protein